MPCEGVTTSVIAGPFLLTAPTPWSAGLLPRNYEQAVHLSRPGTSMATAAPVMFRQAVPSPSGRHHEQQRPSSRQYLLAPSYSARAQRTTWSGLLRITTGSDRPITTRPEHTVPSHRATPIALSDNQIQTLATELAAGRSPTVWFTADAVGIDPSRSGKVVALSDPAEPDWIRVRPAGSTDTLAFSPSELTLTRPARRQNRHTTDTLFDVQPDLRPDSRTHTHTPMSAAERAVVTRSNADSNAPDKLPRSGISEGSSTISSRSG